MALRNKNPGDPAFVQFQEIALVQLAVDQMPDLRQPFSEISGVDILDITEMVMDCETVFGFEVDDERLADLKNLDQLWRLIQSHSRKEQKFKEATA